MITKHKISNFTANDLEIGMIVLFYYGYVNSWGTVRITRIIDDIVYGVPNYDSDGIEISRKIEDGTVKPIVKIWDNDDNG